MLKKILFNIIMFGIAISIQGQENTTLYNMFYKAHNEWCLGKSLKFLDPPGPLTGLWSYPGSGNSWMRYLLEQATGIITGSIYEVHFLITLKYVQHRRNGFWERGCVQKKF